MAKRPQARAPASVERTHTGDLRSTLQVALAAKVDAQQVQRDVRRGVIDAIRFSRVWMFNPDQYRRALAYYQNKRRQERDAARRQVV